MPLSVEDLKRKRFQSIMLFAANLRKKSMPSLQGSHWKAEELAEATRREWSNLSYAEKLAADTIANEKHHAPQLSLNNYRYHQASTPVQYFQYLNLEKATARATEEEKEHNNNNNDHNNHHDHDDEESKQAAKKFCRAVRNKRKVESANSSGGNVHDELQELNDLITQQRRRIPSTHDHPLKRRRRQQATENNDDLQEEFEDMSFNEEDGSYRHLYRGKRQ